MPLRRCKGVGLACARGDAARLASGLRAVDVGRYGQAHGAQLVADPLDVGAGPEDPPTAGTAGEVRLGVEDVGGHATGDSGFRYRDDGLVAAQTPVEEVRDRVEAAGADDLGDLVPKVVAVDEHDWRRVSLTQQLTVTSQNGALLVAGVADERPAAQVAAVGRVLTEQTQPRGQATEHFIDGEPR